VALVPWPEFREDALAVENVTVVVQVNGKLRGRFTARAGSDETTLERLALAEEKVARFIADKPLRKVIVVPDKLVNIVV
jgi:leucyl-tRNA synthetase